MTRRRYRIEEGPPSGPDNRAHSDLIPIGEILAELLESPEYAELRSYMADAAAPERAA